MQTAQNGTVRWENAGGAASIVMDRPKVRNAFDDHLVADLREAVRAVADDDGARVVVLRGDGPHFSAGADLNWMRESASLGAEANRASALAAALLMEELDQLAKPTIAAIRGGALGGGAGIAACCDVVVAERTAFFSFAEVRLGVIPAVISRMVIRAIGARQARRYFLTGERFGAVEAERIGLVHELVADRALDPGVARITEHLMQSGPQAVREAKEWIRFVESGAETAESAADKLAEIRATEEAQEGLSAFLEKRPPSWTR